MTPKLEPLQQRRALLTALCIWEGRLNNGRVRELFGIGAVRASEWIREFRESMPGWLALDSKTRSYVSTPAVYHSHKGRRGLHPDPAATLGQYLSLVGLPHSQKGTTADRGLWAAFPDVSPPNPRIFAVLSESIRLHQKVQITYRSMREPQPHTRTLSAHSMVRAGRRWHVRAYCDESGGFRDFNLGRIVDAKPRATPATGTAGDDEAWSTMVHVRLIAHPSLTFEQQDLIRFEFFNSTAARVDSCRGALVSYFIQDVRAAIDPAVQIPPDYQLAVENAEEIRPWLFPS